MLKLFPTADLTGFGVGGGCWGWGLQKGQNNCYCLAIQIKSSDYCQFLLFNVPIMIVADNTLINFYYAPACRRQEWGI